MTFGRPDEPSQRTLKEDRRIASRQKSFAEVWADPGGTTLAIPCKVIDISKTGAKVSDFGEAPLPDDFVLHSAGVKYRAHVVWRRQKSIGVEFVAPQD